MRKIISVIYLAILVSCVPLTAQITFDAIGGNISCDATSFCVDIEVTNFDSIVGLQFAMQWDTSIMQIDNNSSSLPTFSEFNIDSLTVGKIGFSWFSLNEPSLDLVDGTSIIQLCFVSNGTGTSAVSFIPPLIEGGIIEVTGIVNGTLMQNVPNQTFNNGSVIISDMEDPVIACPSDTIIMNGGVTIVGDIAPVSFMDNCSTPNVTYSLDMMGSNVGSGTIDASDSSFSPGTTTVTYTAADEAGNTGNCMFDVTIDNSNASGMLEFIPQVNFDCDNNTVSIDVVVNNFDSIVGMQFGIRWDMGILDFIMETNNLPEVSNYNTTIEPGAILFTWAHFSSMPSSTSLPDGTVIFTLDYDLVGSLTSPLLSFEDFNPAIPILIGNEDGNLMQGVDFDFLPEVLTLIDNTDPTFPSGCPMDFSVDTDPGKCAAFVDLPAAMATDDCTMIDSITYTVNGTTAIFPVDSASIEVVLTVGVFPVTYTAYDSNGNTATCTYNVTVNDNEDPTVICPVNIMANTDMDACTATVELPFPNGSDNCGIDSAHYVINGMITGFQGFSSAMATFDQGTTSVTYAVFDGAGNTASCMFDVIVSDAQDPTISCPNDFNVNTDFGNCTTTIGIPFPTAMDNCGIDSITYTLNGTTTTFSGTSSVPVIFSIGTTNVIYTAHSAANTASCNFDVIVTDNEDPTITCPNDIMANVNAGNCFTTVNLPFPTASDNCGVDSITYTVDGMTATFIGMADASVSFAAGTTNVTYTVHSGANTASCNFDVIVTDNEDPTISCPNDFNVNTDFGTCTTTIGLPFPTAMDNCGIDSITYTFNGTTTTFSGTSSVPATFPIGMTNVVYTAHSGMQTAQCDFNVNVNDNELPTITCPSDTSLALVGGMSTIVVGNIAPTVADNCSTPSISYALTNATELTGNGDASGQSFNQGSTLVTYYAVDDNGNLDSCSFNVIVNSGLSISCIADFSVNVDVDACSAAQNFDGLTILSNPANITSIAYTLSAPSMASGNTSTINETFNVGVTTVEYSVMDNMMQTATCTFDVTVVDNQQPTISCPSIDVTPNDPGSCDAMITIDLTPTASDNCSIDSVTYVLSNGLTGSGNGTVPNMTYPVGTTTVTYTAHDASGLTQQCAFDVVVGDSESPSITCPSNISMMVAMGTTTQTLTIDAPTTADNCSIMETSYTYNTNTFIIPMGATTIDLDFPIGVTTVTGSVTDASGNSTPCTFTVTLSENILDVIDCPADVFSCSNVVLNIDPIYLVDESTTDVIFNIQGPNSSLAGIGPASGQTFEAGQSVVTYTTTIPGSDMCSFTVTVDDELPTFDSCPAPITAYADAGGCQATVSWDVPIPSDNCGIALTIPSNSPPTTFPVGNFTISYVTLDSASNQAICAFEITVLDTIAPSIANCPPTDIMLTDLPGTCGSTATWTAPNAMDNCSPVNVESTHSPGDTFLITTTVTYTFTDGFDNSSDCSFEVMVSNVDMEDPVIVGCPTDTIIFTDLGVCTSVYNWIEPTVTDDCSNAFIDGSSDPGDTFPLGLTSITYIAFDQVGNQATCSFNVTVRDTIPPSITCPAPIVALADDPSLCGAIVNDWNLPIATDFCPGAINVNCNFVPGDFFEVGTTLVTCTATDISGNSEQCVFTVTVDDVVAPTIDCAGDVVVNLDGTVVSGDNIIVNMVPNSNCDSVQVFFTAPVGMDNCPDVNTSQTEGPANNTLLPIGEMINYKYVVTDDSGLQDSCEFSITVNPLAAVSIDASTTAFCAGGDVSLSVSPIDGATYTWTTPVGTVMGTTIDISNAAATAAGDYTVICDLNGCTSTDMVSLMIGEAPIINAFSVNPICNDDLNLMVAIDPLSSPIDSFRWVGPDNFTASIAQPTVPNAESGDYILTAYSNGCSTSDTVGVDFTTINTPEAFSDCNETICLGESCTLLGTVYDNPLTQYHWESVDGCAEVETGSSTVVFTPTSAGDCTFRYWASVNDCASDTAFITITATEAPMAMPDFVAINNETTSIDFNVLSNDNVNPNANFSITSSTPEDGVLTNNEDGTFTYQPGPSFSVMDQFVYEVCYNCDNSPLCDFAVVTIEAVDTSCTVPTIITPNGDDVNDELKISCLESDDYPNNELIIYNEWGDEIFRASPYGNGLYWNGENNGSPLPDGTYFYMFRLNATATPDKGYITIFR